MCSKLAFALFGRGGCLLLYLVDGGGSLLLGLPGDFAGRRAGLGA